MRVYDILYDKIHALARGADHVHVVFFLFERDLEQVLYRLIVLYDKYFSHFDPPWAD